MKVIAHLKYFLRESVSNLWYSKGVNFISIATIAVSLYILGIFLLLMINVSLFFGELSEKLQIDIFLSDDIPDTSRETIADTLGNDEMVKDFSYVTKEEALNRFREDFPDMKDLPRELKENPLPASFEVTIHESKSSDEEINAFIEQYRTLSGVDEVRCDRDWIERLRSYLNLMKGGGVLLGGILYLAAAFTISNVIRLNVYSRRDEIEIMRLVGATNNFIRGPFLFEGILQGVLGAFASIIILYITYWFFISYTKDSYNIILGFFTSTFISIPQIILIIVSGAAIGITGSFISLRKFLAI